MMVPSPRNR
jgi:exonuclease V